MGAVTPFLATRAGEFVIDKELAALDRDEAASLERGEYVNKRSDEIYERRIANLSDEDFIIAIERITTLRTEVAVLKHKVFSDETKLGAELRGMIKGALLCDSIDIAIAESRAL
jgi:hypothetical protein